MADYIGHIQDKNNNSLHIQETFSTKETKTNQVWIDGKPIYRRVIEGSTSKSQSGNSFTANLGMDRLISANGWYCQGNSAHLVQFLSDNSAIGCNKDSGALNIWFNNTTADTFTFTLIIEYTKRP